MNLMSDAQAVSWCDDHGLMTDGAVASSRIRFRHSPSTRIRIQLPSDAAATVGLAYTLMMTSVGEYEERNFAGALIWLQRWEIWSEQIDRAGYVLLDGIRAASGRSIEMGSAPAHLFASNEFASAHACLALPMLFQWDAYLVPPGGDFLAFVSHERHIDLVTRDPQNHAALLRRFREWLFPESAASTRGAG